MYKNLDVVRVLKKSGSKVEDYFSSPRFDLHLDFNRLLISHRNNQSRIFLLPSEADRIISIAVERLTLISYDEGFFSNHGHVSKINISQNDVDCAVEIKLSNAGHAVNFHGWRTTIFEHLFSEKICTARYLAFLENIWDELASINRSIDSELQKED